MVSMIITNIAFLVLKSADIIVSLIDFNNILILMLQTIMCFFVNLFYSIEFYLQLAVNNLARDVFLNVFITSWTRFIFVSISYICMPFIYNDLKKLKVFSFFLTRIT